MKDRLFLFCIGGTGARVLKSLLFLMASGVQVSAREIIPIIIDPDDNNGDVQLTMQLLLQYENIRNKAHSNQSKFFATQIKNLASAGSPNSDSDLSKGFRGSIQAKALQGITFGNFIEYGTLDLETKALMDVLYSQQHNLNSDLSVGFKGNPHMGSVVLNRMKDTADFSHFVSSLQPGDRVFIVSSIFGGTGASGFPLLVKNIRQPDSKYIGKQALLQSLPLGAVSVLPYFGVKPDAASAINKDTFIGKTKAALRHYGADLNGLNALYYLGDEILSDYDNHEGSKEQMNQAHFVEMAAALAVIDFMEVDASTLNQGGVFREFGIHGAEDLRSFHFKNLGARTKNQIAKPLTQFFYTLKHWENRLPQAVRDHNMVYINGSPRSNSQPISNTFLGTDFYSNQLNRFTQEFKQWMLQIAQNQRSFAPFNWNTGELQHMVIGIEQKKMGMLFKTDKWDYKDFDTALNEADPQTGGLTQEQKFLALYDMATSALFDERIQDGL